MYLLFYVKNFKILDFPFPLLTTATKRPAKESPIPRLEKFDRDFQSSQGSLDGTTERKDSDPIRILANPAVAEPLKHGKITVCIQSFNDTYLLMLICVNLFRIHIC